ncbi:hypothetical protein [Ornithinimicrobium cryptoxanthini]|uniref:Uncharacterized protein n=1 Tax=Ornithinimicrobium cryptoxanthini TaxID=2934161 RepID=A0ABY4YHQ6_9MICO|nr:hypothetical protein [Ornithinimicrobium cryptoxanthini]USQ76144.1 hypothetical protein NF557_16385 [Ornithinimicrobium cryptoxanthini]
MYPSQDARELSILLRISRELDVVGDITATVDNPSELLAWARILSDPTMVAWRADDSGHRYVQVTALHHRAPVRGQVTAVLHCGPPHYGFWDQLIPGDLEPGTKRLISLKELAAAWSAMPITPPS